MTLAFQEVTTLNPDIEYDIIWWFDFVKGSLLEKLEISKSPHHTRRSKSESRLTSISTRQVIFSTVALLFCRKSLRIVVFSLWVPLFQEAMHKMPCLLDRLIIKCSVFHANCVSRILSISDLRVLFIFLYLYMFSDLHTMIISHIVHIYIFTFYFAEKSDFCTFVGHSAATVIWARVCFNWVVKNTPLVLAGSGYLPPARPGVLGETAMTWLQDWQINNKWQKWKWSPGKALFMVMLECLGHQRNPNQATVKSCEV